MNRFNYIGHSIPRADGPDKVCGRYDYLADLPPSGILHGAVVFSDRAHALIKSIDFSAALALPGVKKLCYEDAPQNRYNSGEWFLGQKDHPDETVLTGHARHVGDRIALILAPDRATALLARSLVKVEYEELPAMVDYEEAVENSALLHDDGESFFTGALSYGDVEAAFAHAAHIEKDAVHTPKIHHAAMEPHAVMAFRRPENLIEVHSPCQIMFGVQHAVSQVLPLPLAKIRIIKTRMGGSFGGKQEVVFEPLCAWAAWKMGCGVIIETDRSESILATRTRAAAYGEVETALDSQGHILGRRFKITVDAGAYLSGSKKVLMAMGKKASRLYKLPALQYEGRVVRTSTTPAGACRGYGSPQIHAITEIHTDLMCRRLSFDPVEFRVKNLIKPYDADLSGASNLGNARILDCLEKGLKAFEWEKVRQPSGQGRFRRGAGFALSTHGNGYYKTIYHDFANMRMRIMEDGSAVLLAGVHELGNAAVAALTQIVAEATSIEPGKINIIEGDTLANSYDIGCQASRGIFVMGECARLCAVKTMELLKNEAEKLWGVSPALANGFLEMGKEKIPLGEAVRQIELQSRTSICASVEHRPDKNPASYGAHFVDLEVDTFTGLVKIKRYVAVHDIGQAINPSFVEGQIYGGIQMGLGMALTEELSFDENGRPSAYNFDKYHMFNAPDMPEVEVILVEEGEEGGPFGAKSIGEIATVPVAPAVVNALNRALDLSLCHLPLSPARIVAGLTGKKEPAAL